MALSFLVSNEMIFFLLALIIIFFISSSYFLYKVTKSIDKLKQNFKQRQERTEAIKRQGARATQNTFNYDKS